MKLSEFGRAVLSCSFFLPFLLTACGAQGLAADDTIQKPPNIAADETESIITREETIDTQVGEKRLVRTDARILDVAVTKPEVAEIFVTEAQGMVVSANSAGVGRAIVKLSDGARVGYTIRVYVADPEEFAAEFRKKIGDISGVNVEVVKGRILVDGRVLYLKDMDAIESAVGDNPSIINLTSLSSRNARILAREIQREFRESGIYGALVEVRNNKVTLVGSLGSELLVKKAERIASSYTADFENLIKVNPEPRTGEPRAK
ncbi:MAG: pilus assembly protein N-terminal domain-containing protein [Candidatus Lindowbacteria bacterium]|nr:pilus assembly protein N-terminal domain-containing protein [Candidatus Lindowbacteria bacterium]